MNGWSLVHWAPGPSWHRYRRRSKYSPYKIIYILWNSIVGMSKSIFYGGKEDGRKLNYYPHKFCSASVRREGIGRSVLYHCDRPFSKPPFPLSLALPDIRVSILYYALALGLDGLVKRLLIVAYVHRLHNIVRCHTQRNNARSRPVTDARGCPCTRLPLHVYYAVSGGYSPTSPAYALPVPCLLTLFKRWNSTEMINHRRRRQTEPGNELHPSAGSATGSRTSACNPELCRP